MFNRFHSVQRIRESAFAFWKCQQISYSKSLEPFCVMRAAWTKFSLYAGKMRFSAHNEELLRYMTCVMYLCLCPCHCVVDTDTDSSRGEKIIRKCGLQPKQWCVCHSAFLHSKLVT
jgi:hypothetical protein